MSVAQPPAPPESTTDQMRVIAAAAELAEPFRQVAPTSRLWYGEPQTPFDVTFSTSQFPTGFGWEMTITRQEWGRTAMSMCSLSHAPGSTDVDPTWGVEASPYLASLEYALRTLACKRRGMGAA